MSLQDEIDKYSYSLYEEYGDRGVTEEDSQDVIDTHQLPKIINKVLDAACASIDELYGKHNLTDNQRKVFVRKAKTAINKLRPDS